MNSYVSATSRSASKIVEFNSTHPPHFLAIEELKAEEKWAGWQTLLFILATCGVFWTAVLLTLRALFF